MLKKLYRGIFLSCLMLVGCQHLSPLDRDNISSCGQFKKSDLSFNSEIPLYTSNCKGYKINEVETVLDNLFESGKPVVLFVHGRGSEPGKSLIGKGMLVDGQAVQKIEAEYNAKVLLYSWDSERGGWGPFGILDRGRPLSNMPAAAESFNKILQIIKQYKANKNQDIPFVLMAHSMGTIVIQTFVEKYGWPSDKDPIFSNVILSSADADNLGHEKWVERISAIENVYITINNGDAALKKSTDHRHTDAQALGLNPGSKLAKNANYVDITGLGSSTKHQNDEDNDHHEMFNKCAMFKQVNVCHFYDSVVTGNKPSFNSESVTNINNGPIYQLRSKIDKSDACFNVQCDW